MRALLATIVWLSLVVYAGDIWVPPRLEVDDGAFLSIPVEVDGLAQSLDLDYPTGFKPLSLPDLKKDIKLINFLVERGMPSGDYPIRFKIVDEGGVMHTAICTVFVKPRVEFALEAPLSQEVLLGNEVRYWVGVVNSGNIADAFTVEVRFPSNDVAVEPKVINLPAGGRGGFVVTARPEQTQLMVVILAVRSKRNPELVKYLGIRTEVLPFAGADKLGSRSLYYQIKGSGGIRDDRWQYSLQTRLIGRLSDYVFGTLGASYTPGHPYLGIELNSEWGRLGLLASRKVYEGYVFSGEWKGRLRYSAKMPSGSLAWRPGSWKFSLNASYYRQRFSVGDSIPLAKWLRVEPSLFVDRFSPPGAIAYFEPGGEVRLKLDSPDWLMTARLTYQSKTLVASGDILRRRVSGYGFRGHWFYSGGNLGVNLEAGEAVGKTYWISQRLFYLRNNIGWHLGLRYFEDGFPWRVSLAVKGVNLSPGGYAKIEYKQPYWNASGSLGWNHNSGYNYKLQFAYYRKKFNMHILYIKNIEQKISTKVEYNWKNWQLAGDYNFSLTNRSGSGGVEILYNFSDWTLKSGISNDNNQIKWWLAGKLQIEGGFETPEAIVQTFGGRKTGLVNGLVYLDQNKNGKYEQGEPRIAGAYISCADSRVVSDSAGRYSLERQPGKCQLSVQDPKGRYGLTDEIKLSFTANGSQRLDLGLLPVTGLTGVVWLDSNQNGARDKGENHLAGVEVQILGPNGFTNIVRSDARGRFTISYLSPGTYQVKLLPNNLPRLAQPGPPVEIELQPGPLPFIGLAAIPRELRRIQTYSLDDASINVELSRQSAPPGSELPLRVTVSGMKPSSVYVATKGGRQDLLPAGEGIYTGYLIIPDDAKGVFFYKVVAQGPDGEAHQEAMVVIAPGPLAQLSVQPAFADPGEGLNVTVSFLKRVKNAEIIVNNKTYSLRRLDDLTWTLKLKAPEEPGRYTIELRVNGEKWAEAAFRVAE